MKPNNSELLLNDEELLYRRVLEKTVNWDTIPPVISSVHFFDREFYVSVDRAAIINFCPEVTQAGVANGVAQFYVYDLHAEPIDKLDSQGRQYNGRVYAAPIEEDQPNNIAANPAHAEVRLDPSYENQKAVEKVFRKLREKLASVAMQHGWAIAPIKSE